MTTERDVDKLLGVILEKSRFVTGADAGSIYVVEGDATARLLRFKLTQNDSVSFDSREFLMPLNSRSIAGSAAEGKKRDQHRRRLRPATWRRRSASTDASTSAPATAPSRCWWLPLIIAARRGHRRHPAHQQEARLETRSSTRRPTSSAQVVPFDERSEELLGMLAAQAGVSLENALLYDEIRLLVRGVREGERRGHRVARPDDERSLAARGGPHRAASPRSSTRRATGPFRDATLQPRGPARARVREPAPRLRQDWRAREGPRQGQEALRRAARAHSCALRLRRANRSRPTF